MHPSRRRQLNAVRPGRRWCARAPERTRTSHLDLRTVSLFQMSYEGVKPLATFPPV